MTIRCINPVGEHTLPVPGDTMDLYPHGAASAVVKPMVVELLNGFGPFGVRVNDWRSGNRGARSKHVRRDSASACSTPNKPRPEVPVMIRPSATSNADTATDDSPRDAWCQVSPRSVGSQTPAVRTDPETEMGAIINPEPGMLDTPEIPAIDPPTRACFSL